MQDMIPRGTGNSRYMKSNIPSDCTMEQLVAMLRNGTFPYDLGTINGAGVAQQGTPLNTANLFSDQTAALYPAGTETVDQALATLAGVAGYKIQKVLNTVLVTSSQ